MGERGEFLPAGPTPCTVEDCPLEGVALINGRKYCGGHAADFINLNRPPRTISLPPVLAPGVQEAIEEVVQAYRDVDRWAVPGPKLRQALDALADRWPS